MPRKTTDIRIADADEPNVLRLSTVDLSMMVASQARAEAAEKSLQVAHMRRQLVEVQKEADALKHAERYRVLHEVTGQGIETAKADLQAKKDQHNAMTQGLATKYRVDWASCGYDELTGVITKL